MIRPLCECDDESVFLVSNNNSSSIKQHELN